MQMTEQKTNRPELAQGILLLILLLTGLLIWPFGLIPVPQQDASLEYGMTPSGVISEETPLSGIVQFSSGRPKRIGFRLQVPHRRSNPGTLRLTLTDGAGQLLCTQEVALQDVRKDYYDFAVPSSLAAGTPCIFQLTSAGAGDAAPTAFLGSPQTACPGFSAAYYGGAPLNGQTPVMRLESLSRASFTRSLPYWLSILAASIVLLCIRKGGTSHV